MSIIKMPFHVPPSRLYLPVLAMALFVLFYVVAALKYPGGSWNDPQHTGFSIWNNYLCDLLDTYAINGSVNTARIWSIIALAVLCSGLFYLWYHLPILFVNRNKGVKIMWWAGMLAFISTLTLSAKTHDISVWMSGFFGTTALVALIAELVRNNYVTLYPLGILCLFVFLMNYGIYETRFGIEILPAFQKVTFTLFFLWFLQLNRVLYKVNRKIHPLEESGVRHKFS